MQIVGGIEDEVLAPLTSWETEEDARKIRLAGICNELAAKGQRVYMDMAEIEAAIAELEAFDLSTMQEYKIGAESRNCRIPEGAQAGTGAAQGDGSAGI